jgi:hypothetical protein
VTPEPHEINTKTMLVWGPDEPPADPQAAYYRAAVARKP